MYFERQSSHTARERFHGRVDFKIFLMLILAENTGSAKHEYQNRSTEGYIFNGLTILLNCKDSIDNKIPFEPYPEKEKKETAVHYF